MTTEEKVTPPVVDPADPPITTNDDAFGSAWDEATAPTMKSSETAPAKPAVETPPVETPPAKTAEELALEKKAADDAAEAQRVADAAAAVKPPVVETPPETPPVETPPVEAAPLKPYEFSKEEQDALAAYEKEWPELAAAQSTVMKAGLYNALQYAFAEVHKTYDPVMKRFEALGDMMEEQLTLIELRAGVPEYDELYSQIEPWIKTLPAAHRRGAEQVWKEGTVAEVIDLCKEFKKTKPAASAPATPKPTPKVLTPAAEKAAAKLTAVDGTRTTAVTTPDPNDFEEAWKEATAGS